MENTTRDTNDQAIRDLKQAFEDLKKEMVEMKKDSDVYTLAPRILDVAIESRGEKAPYVSGGYTVECDVVLSIDWQGRRYLLPAFEL